MSNVIVLLVLALLIWAVYRFFLKPGASKMDYSFGMDQLKRLTQLLNSGKANEALQIAAKLNSDDLTQACDCLALSLNEKTLMKFQQASSDSDFSTLIAGVYHGHAAWKSRGHGYADSVSSTQADLFDSHLEKSREYLRKISKNSFLYAEANARLVRVCMGLGLMDEASEHYNVCRNTDNTHLWNYIHYSEMIQPKWGGSVDQIKRFYESLPDNEQIKLIIRLKLLYDGMTAGVNYFNPDESVEAYSEEVKKEILELDSGHRIMNVKSVHRYVVYGYMFGFAEMFSDKALHNKYWKLMDGKFALYPFGIQ